MLSAAIAQTPTQVPIQHFYTKEKAVLTQIIDGCTKRQWKGKSSILASSLSLSIAPVWLLTVSCIKTRYARLKRFSPCYLVRPGMDAGGMAGYPWMSTIECAEGSEYVDHGSNLHGHVRFYLYKGKMEVNNKTLDLIGSAYWVDGGSEVNLRVSGSVYVIGAHFDLQKGVPGSFFTSSYNASSERAYDVWDALSNGGNGTDGAALHPDPHIRNGTTNAKDIVWGKHSVVEPPSIAVLNCAPEGLEVPLYGSHSPYSSYVWYHSHPQGAVYLPYSGAICFQTDTIACIEPGEPRWTSANLYYIEFFKKIKTVHPQADELVRLAGMTDCEYPVTFGVTNFDPDDVAGQPNFLDVPENAKGRIPWGTFPSLTVRNTIVQSAITNVEAQPHGE